MRAGRERERERETWELIYLMLSAIASNTSNNTNKVLQIKGIIILPPLSRSRFWYLCAFMNLDCFCFIVWSLCVCLFWYSLM